MVMLAQNVLVPVSHVHSPVLLPPRTWTWLTVLIWRSSCFTCSAARFRPSTAHQTHVVYVSHRPAGQHHRLFLPGCTATDKLSPALIK